MSTSFGKKLVILSVATKMSKLCQQWMSLMEKKLNWSFLKSLFLPIAQFCPAFWPTHQALLCFYGSTLGKTETRFWCTETSGESSQSSVFEDPFSTDGNEDTGGLSNTSHTSSSVSSAPRGQVGTYKCDMFPISLGRTRMHTECGGPQENRDKLQQTFRITQNLQDNTKPSG